METGEDREIDHRDTESAEEDPLLGAWTVRCPERSIRSIALFGDVTNVAQTAACGAGQMDVSLLIRPVRGTSLQGDASRPRLSITCTSAYCSCDRYGNRCDQTLSLSTVGAAATLPHSKRRDTRIMGGQGNQIQRVMESMMVVSSPRCHTGSLEAVPCSVTV